MLPEIELFNPSNNILLIIQIFIIKMLNELSLNQTLFIEPSLILKDFKCSIFSRLVVITFQYYTETTFA